VRAFLNEGGKLLYSGKNAAAQYMSGYAYDPVNDAACPQGDNDCESLSNDFVQYYLSLWSGDNVADVADAALEGLAEPFEDLQIDFVADAPQSAMSFDTTTSDAMPADVYPQFASQSAGEYVGAGAKPHSGEHYLYSGSTYYTWHSLTRTVDLTGALSGTLSFWANRNLRQPFDALIVEARTPEAEDWTTLPDANGHTAQNQARRCDSSAWYTLFPRLVHYQTPDDSVQGGCRPEGTTGVWHAATGASQGWEEWKVDLAAYAGKQVELSITHLTSRVAFPGMFLDDVSLTVDGTVVAETSFEEDLGGWTLGGLPVNTPEAPEHRDFERVTKDALRVEGAVVTTADTITLGFGLESVAEAADRVALVDRSLRHLGILPEPPPDTTKRIYLPVLKKDVR
jgi:hypothetical protein